MNLYTVAFTARQADGTVLRLKPGIVLASDDDDATARVLTAAKHAFPEADGWSEHNAIVAAIPSPLGLEGYRLTWHIEATE